MFQTESQYEYIDTYRQLKIQKYAMKVVLLNRIDAPEIRFNEK